MGIIRLVHFAFAASIELAEDLAHLMDASLALPRAAARPRRAEQPFLPVHIWGHIEDNLRFVLFPAFDDVEPHIMFFAVRKCLHLKVMRSCVSEDGRIGAKINGICCVDLSAHLQP